jgi:hypothetical protein
MALDVTIETEDDSDSSLNETITLRNVKYDVDFDRGVKVFRLKILRVFQNALKAIGFGYVWPPVVALDGGSTVWYYNLECYLVGNRGAANGPVHDVERQMVEMQEFFERKCYIADRCYLKIGDRIASSTNRFVWRSGKGIEGKIMNGKFQWVSKQQGIIKLTFKFLDCIDLDLY